jgi:hypothetical protein
MHAIARLTLLLSLPLVCAACGAAAISEDVAAPRSPSDLFVVRPDGPNGPLVGFEMPSARETFRLPTGITSADGRSYFSAHSLDGHTHVSAFDPRTGKPRQGMLLDGDWTLAAVGPNGRGLALWRQTRDGSRTDVEVVDARTGAHGPPLVLDGDFEVETISGDGRSLFLVEHLPDGQYRIRLYDLPRARLVAGALRSKGSAEVMAGYAWNGAATPDGTWLLTLYLSTARNVAFVHALNVVERFPFCIDLPSGDGDFATLKAYSLTVVPGGETLYAANPKLGVVATIDLAQLRVVSTVEFAPEPGAGERTQSALSRDGSALYFSNGESVWAYDTTAATVELVHRGDEPVGGIGVSRGGETLYVAPRGSAPQAVALNG